MSLHIIIIIYWRGGGSSTVLYSYQKCFFHEMMSATAVPFTPPSPKSLLTHHIASLLPCPASRRPVSHKVFYDKLVGIKYGTVDGQSPAAISSEPPKEETPSNGSPRSASMPTPAAAAVAPASDLPRNGPPDSSVATVAEAPVADTPAVDTTSTCDPAATEGKSRGEGETDAPHRTDPLAEAVPSAGATPMDVAPATIPSKEEAIAAVEPIAPKQVSSTAAGSSAAGTTCVSTAVTSTDEKITCTPPGSSGGASEEVRELPCTRPSPAPAPAPAPTTTTTTTATATATAAVKSEERQVVGKGAVADGGPLRVSMRLSNEMPEFLVVMSKYDEAVRYQWRSEMHIQMAFMEEPGESFLFLVAAAAAAALRV